MILLLALLTQELLGDWQGTMKAGSSDYRIVFKFEPGGATMNSLDQGDYGRKIEKVELKDRTLRLEIQSIGGIYEGALNADGSEIVGRWKQGPATLPLNLKRLAQPFVLKRPQEPKPPFPYDAEEVEFANVKGGATLAGTLTKPKGPGPFPAVLLITGSGSQDRDETIMGHKPFWVLADALTRRGIAVLRADDRGVGKSTGSPLTATTLDLSEDSRAGVRFLRARKDVAKVGLIGHSEGGIIAPMLAGDVDFMVLLAGTGVPGDELLKLQTEALGKASGADPATRARSLAIAEKIHEILKTEDDPKELERKIGALPLPPQGRNSALLPWTRWFVRYDPRPALRRVNCPVLALIGEKDGQVPPLENLAGIREALKEHKDAEIRELPGLNHLFQRCKTGAMKEYGEIEETFDADALKLIGDWILRRAER